MSLQHLSENRDTHPQTCIQLHALMRPLRRLDPGVPVSSQADRKAHIHTLKNTVKLEMTFLPLLMVHPGTRS